MKIIPRLPSAPRNDNGGAAIVIVLAFLVMITFVVVAFFTRATANRQVENSSAAGKKAALLARSAGDLVVADLVKEMALPANSTISGTIPWQTFTPKTNLSMIPTRVMNSSLTTDPNFLNLVKQSGVGSASTGGLIPLGAIPTSTPSQDGHMVGGVRWSAPKLTGNTNGTVDFSNSQVPNWILVTRSGIPAIQTAMDPTYKNPITSNSNYVIGRFAFNVYDEGGLLDVNVAGLPTSIISASGTDASLKGSQGVVDLGLIPGVTNADSFVKSWRNLATGQSSANYLAYLGIGDTNNQFYNVGPKYGFLKSGTTTAASDNRLLGRQDLIRLANNGTLGLTAAALPFLTTYSRSLNAPTYTPDPNRAMVSDPIKAKGQDNIINVGLLSSTARVTKVFTRADGTKSVIGEPPLKHRFPLSRLALLTPTAICTSTVNDPVGNPIYTFFGLTRTRPTDPWVYAHNTTGVKLILNMKQVQSQSREPDFFELLQTSINLGSLGKGWNTLNGDDNTYVQILQIGANLIDQADSDSYPTHIQFATGGNPAFFDIYGVENLPYFNRIIANVDRDQPISGTPPTGVLGVWLQAEIWNPHQQINLSGPGPKSFRYNATGSAYLSADYLVRSGSAAPYTYTQATITGTYTFPANMTGIQFNLPANRFSTPTLLDPSNITSSDPHDSTTDLQGRKLVGLYSANAVVPQIYWEVPSYYVGATGYIGATTGAAPTVNFQLQYQDANNNWITYSRIANCSMGVGGNGCASIGGNACGFVYTADPRSNRFGYFQACSDGTPDNAIGVGNTMRPDYTRGGWPGPGCWGQPSIAADNTIMGTALTTYPNFVCSWGGGFYGYFIDNKSTNSSYYKDSDGVLRPGNANRDYGTGADGEEMQIPAASNTSRPIILNRPFRSVAEMGYAFRDDPWRTLDFFSKYSADSALLDTFCIDEQSGSSLTAGVLNLNTRQQPVIKAVVNGVLKDAATTTSTLSNTDADTIAAVIASTTTASPMMNRSELATKISPALNYSSSTDKAIKARRESAIRALADAGDTRTWNLLIDVVAQSGRFPTTAAAPDKFLVEGECRYWLHVAIDRFTGQVIDQSLEVVNE
jgi:hypothetical protein